MSLSKCKECGNDVSNQAKTCPHCGARVKKSRWGIVVLFALFVVALAVALPIMRGRSIEQKKTAVERDMKEYVKTLIIGMLYEKYNTQCTSIDIGQMADGSFAGTANLDDGREIVLDDVRLDGEMIHFSQSVKEGYEYKCKHHFNQLKIGEKPGLWGSKVTVLVGEIWNDGSEPIRGFIASEFVEDSGNTYYKSRDIAFIPKADQLTGISADYWIAPGKNAIFICSVPDEMLKLSSINARLEFFNLGNESAASYVFDNLTDKSVLESISVKVTSQIYKIQIDKENKDAEQ